MGPTFIIGSGQCGSRFVHRILARHPEVAFVSGLEDRLSVVRPLASLSGRLYRSLPPAWARNGSLPFGPSVTGRAVGRDISECLVTSFRDLNADDMTPWLAERLRRFFDDRAGAGRSERVLCHRFTGWPRASFLLAAFPDARFIHVVRDGRAVANAWLQTPTWSGHRGPGRWDWGPLPAEYERQWVASGRSFGLLAGIAWMMLIDAHEQACERVPQGQWMELRYEDIVAEPEEAFEQMLGFMGLEMTPTFARRLASAPIRHDQVNAYVREMAARDLAIVDFVLRQHLARCGYLPAERAVAARPSVITLPEAERR
jgi:hypothetical protein